MSQQYPIIRFRPNGPVVLIGEGTRVITESHEIHEHSNVALCRCGHSKNPPYCDKSHQSSPSSEVSTDEAILAPHCTPAPQGIPKPLTASALSHGAIHIEGTGEVMLGRDRSLGYCQSLLISTDQNGDNASLFPPR